MATRYAVATGTWDATNTAIWAATSGGAPGASVPTAADDVVMDAASGAITVTMASGTFSCLTLTCTGYTGTLTGGVTVAGSVTLGSGMTLVQGNNQWVLTGTGSHTITSAGKGFQNTVNVTAGVGTYTLADAFSSTNITLTLTSGTFATANFAVTCSTFTSSNSNTRTVTLGSSSITVTGASNPAWNTTTSSGLTVTANTAMITMTGASTGFAAGGKNYNGASLVFSGSGGAFLNANGGTFANVTRTGTAVKTDSMAVQNAVTVTGTFTVTGNSTVNRVNVTSNGVGTASTVTAGAVSFSNVDFGDITIAGAGAGAAVGTSVGNALGNSGITFTPATTRYGVVAGNWSSTATWSTVSGGAGGASVPLPQDTVILDASSAAGTYTADMPRLGASLDATGFTRTLALNSTANTVYGSVTLASGTTLTMTQNLTLGGRGTHTFTTAGKTLGAAPIFTAPGGTYTLQDALTTSSSTNHNAGTLNTNNMAITASAIISNSTTTRTLNLGTSTLTLTATSTSSPIDFSNGGAGNVSSGLTCSAASATFVISGASANPRNIFAGGQTLGTLAYTVAASTGLLNFSAVSAIITLNVSGGARTVKLQSGATTTVTNWNVFGAAGALVSVIAGTAGTAATLRLASGATVPVTTSDYLTVQDITAQDVGGASGDGVWYAGWNSTSVSGNTGWRFGVEPVTATRQTPWAVTAAVTKTQSTTWAVRLAVVQTRQTVYAVRSAVLATRQSLWAVQAAVATTRQTPWAVTAAITQTRQTTWAVRSAVVSSRQTTWAVRTSVAQTRQTSWAAASAVTATRQTSWSVAAVVSTSRATAWQVTSAIATIRQTLWAITTPVTVSRVTVWDVRQAIVAIRGTGWAVLIPLRDIQVEFGLRYESLETGMAFSPLTTGDSLTRVTFGLNTPDTDPTSNQYLYPLTTSAASI